VCLISFPTNRGPSGARNAGLGAARGRWIAILDADDFYSPDRLARLTQAGDDAQADFVCDDLLLVDETTGSPLGPMFGEGGLAPVIDGERFVLGNLPDPKAPRRGYGFLKPIMRNDFLRHNKLRYKEEMRFAEDYAFYVEALIAGASWVSVPQATYHYSVRSNSLTAVHTAQDLFKLCAVDEAALLKTKKDRGLQKALRRHLVSTQKRAAWAHFITLFKEKRPADLVRTATMNRAVFGYIAGQCLYQTLVRSSRMAGLRLSQH
jgi:glycosyltransferase involved in cell wall biosynthesis